MFHLDSNTLQFNNIYILHDIELDTSWSLHEQMPVEDISDFYGIELIPAKGDLLIQLESILAKKNIEIVLVFGAKILFPKALLSKDGITWINFHPTYLPRYRGVSNDSWAFMQGTEQEIGASFHEVVPAIDAGKIYLRMKKLLNTAPLSISERRQVLLNFLKADVFPEFIGLLEQKDLPVGILQNNDEVFYGPSLRSSQNALIDFRWSANDIVSFVKAFSDPYNGASFRYSEEPNTQFYVKSALKISNDSFHAYTWGLIQFASVNKIVFCANEGLVEFQQFSMKKKFRVGSRLYNDYGELQQAILVRI